MKGRDGCIQQAINTAHLLGWESGDRWRYFHSKVFICYWIVCMFDKGHTLPLSLKSVNMFLYCRKRGCPPSTLSQLLGTGWAGLRVWAGLTAPAPQSSSNATKGKCPLHKSEEWACAHDHMSWLKARLFPNHTASPHRWTSHSQTWAASESPGRLV